jgi:glutamyl-tRNA reductase
MELVCLGLSHRSAPVELRERFAIPEIQQGPLSIELASVPGLHESVVISTCNRVEFYALAQHSSLGFEALHAALAQRGMEVSGDAFFQRSCDDVVRHLFRVVCGLDSMVLGETEILGQVKKAYSAAQEARATSKHLNKLFQRAFNVAKEVRTRTNRSGGVQGGISKGEPIVFRVAFKPTATIFKTQQTVSPQGENVELKARGRHDACVLPRAVPMVEAMTVLVLTDHLLRQHAQNGNFSA